LFVSPKQEYRERMEKTGTAKTKHGASHSRTANSTKTEE